MALAKLEAEEAQHQRDVMDSGDGTVHYYGKDTQDQDDGGETE